MEAVIDASTVIDALTDDGPRGHWARGAIDRTKVLVAPHLLPAEVSQVLRRLVSTGRVSAEGAGVALSDLVDLDAIYIDFGSVGARVWELRSTLRAYDAWYVAVAEALNLPLITSDLSLASAPGPTCAFVTPPEAPT